MNEARQQMLERIGEDESLTGELAGDAAERLRQWANDTALAIAQRADLDDEIIQQYIKAVRIAARKAAAHDGDVTVAYRELSAHIGAAAPTLNAPIDDIESTHTPNDVATPVIQPTYMTPAHVSASAPVWGRLRGWWRGVWSRTPKEE